MCLVSLTAHDNDSFYVSSSAPLLYNLVITIPDRSTKMPTDRKKTIPYIIFFAVFAAISLLLFWKCRYGFPADEAMYIAIPFRFITGDIPVLHEWNPTQISYLWLHLPIWSFLKINGGFTGIYLAFRYMFTFCWISSSLFLFMRMRKISFAGAAAASLTLLIYVPYGEMALYYNTICLMTLTAASAIFITAERHLRLQYMLAGFLYAIAVTCCPFLAVGYVAVLVNMLIRRRSELGRLGWATAGISVCAVIFMIYYCCRSSLGEVLHFLPYLAGDREHPIVFTDKIITYFTSLGFSSIAVLPVLFIFSVILIYTVVRKDEKVIRIGFAATCVFVLILQAAYLMSNSYINNYMIAPCLLGLYCSIHNRDDVTGKLFRSFWIPGLLYTVCIHFSSNLGFSSIASAATVMTVASAVIAAGFIRDRLNSKPLIIALVSVALLQFSIQLYFRITYTFAEPDIKHMDQIIDHGSVKGLHLSSNRVFYYDLMMLDTEALRSDDIDRVLIVSPELWMYLDTGKKIGSYTCWLPVIDEYTVKNLAEYYELFPEMRPDAVYVEAYYSDLVPLIKELGYDGGHTITNGYILYPSDHAGGK